MNRRIKIVLIFVLTFLSASLTSCKGATEIDTLGIVIAMGFDLEEGEIVITNEVINPMSASSKESTGKQETTKFVMSRGKTIQDAILNASLTFDRELYFPHVKTIIIGEDLVKKGLDGYIDILSRNNQIRETTMLMIAKDNKASEIMSVNTSLSNSPGKNIYNMTQENSLSGKQRPLNINRFFKYFYSKGSSYVLGVVEKIDKKTVDKDAKNEMMEVLSVEGGALLKDKKLLGCFTGDEMIGFNFIINEFERGVIIFETPKHVTEEIHLEDSVKKYYSSFKVFKNKTKLDVELKGDKLHLLLDLKLRGGLKATQEGVNLNDSIVIKAMENSIEENVERLVSNTLNKAQKEFEADTFSIGELVHRKYPDLWKEIEDQWSEVFKDLDYTINVDANINDVGFTNTTKRIRKSIYE